MSMNFNEHNSIDRNSQQYINYNSHQSAKMRSPSQEVRSTSQRSVHNHSVQKQNVTGAYNLITTNNEYDYNNTSRTNNMNKEIMIKNSNRISKHRPDINIEFSNNPESFDQAKFKVGNSLGIPTK